MNDYMYYFAHDHNARSRPSLVRMRMKYGWEGYGLYWAILEILRALKNYELVLNKDTIDFLSFHLMVDHKFISQYVEESIHNFKTFQVRKKEGVSFLYNYDLCNNMEQMDKRKEQGKKLAQKRWSKTNNQEAKAIPFKEKGSALQKNIGVE